MRSTNIPIRGYGLLVTVVAFLVYANSLGNGFTLDDHVVILNNQALYGNPLALFSKIDPASNSQLLPFYRPFTNLTFLADLRLHNLNPHFIRLFNVLLHAGNTLLVFQLGRFLDKGNILTALFTGLLFAVHPLHSEGVDFNSGGRATMLSCFFVLSAFLLYCKGTSKQSMPYCLAGTTAFLVGLFSKETTLMVLPFIMVYSFAIQTSLPVSSTWRPAFIRLAPFFMATGFYLMQRWQALAAFGLQSSIIPGIGTSFIESRYVTTDLATRLCNNVYIIPRYLLTILKPTDLASRYMLPEDFNLFVLPLAIGWLAIFVCLAWLLSKGRNHITLFGLSWCLLFWLPVSGIALVPGAPLADRFLYLPAIGIWLIIANQCTTRMLQYSASKRRYAMFMLVAILLLLATLTARRNLDWQSDISLHSRFVEQYPENVHARSGLCIAYYNRRQNNDFELAESECEKAVSLDSRFPKVHTILGIIKLGKGDIINALTHLDTAVAILPNDGPARINRGIALEQLGRPQEAIKDYMYFLTIPGGNITSRQRAEERIRILSM